MRPILLLSLATLSGCATHTPSAGAGVSPETVRIVGPSGTTTLSRMVGAGAPAAVTAVAAPLDSAWRALPSVYASLEIPLTTLDAAQHLLGNEGMRVRRTLAGESLTRYLDCGATQGGPNAETYEVTMAVLTQLQPGAADSTIVATAVQASARSPSFSGEDVACTSTRRLEARIAALLGDQLKR
jgi:hypothetical protein